MKTEQIKKAKNLGKLAFDNGIDCVPALNKEIMNIIAGRNIGETPEGEASTMDILKAYINGWMLANMAAPLIEE